MDRTTDIVELSAAQLAQVSGGTGVNLINAQLASTASESAKKAGRKAGEGQKDFLVVRFHEVFIT